MIRPHPKSGARGGKPGAMYDDDLDEDVVITLTAKNPQAPQNIIRFDHTTGEFVTIKLAESMIDHLEIESTSILRDSEEGKKQLQTSGEVKKETDFRSMAAKIAATKKKEKIASFISNEEIGADDEDVDSDEEAD